LNICNSNRGNIMTNDGVAEFLRKNPRAGSSSADEEAPEEPVEPTQAETPPAQGNEGLKYRLQMYVHNKFPGLIPAPAGYVADEASDLETAVQTEGATQGETGSAEGSEEGSTEGTSGSGETTAGESVAANEQETDVKELTPAGKIRNIPLETIIGAGLAPSLAITLAANADHDRYLLERVGEAIGFPGEVIYLGKLATGALYGAVGGALYFGLDGLFNKEFPDFGKNRVSEYLLKLDEEDSNIGHVVSQVIERGGGAGIYAAKYGAAGFAISQLIDLTGVYGFWTTLGVGAATAGGMATGAVVGAVKKQNIPWENEEGYIKKEMPGVPRVIGKGLAGVTTLGFMYLAAMQGADYLLPENSGPLNVGRAIMDTVYTLGLGGMGYISAVTLWNKGEDQTIEKSKEEKEAERVMFAYDNESHTYFGRVGDDREKGDRTNDLEYLKDSGEEFGVCASAVTDGKSASTLITDRKKANRKDGTKGGNFIFSIPHAQLNVLKHEEEYVGRTKEERDLSWSEGESVEYPRIPDAPRIDKGYGAASIDALISDPEKTTITSDGELLGGGDTKEYSLFVSEFVKALFFARLPQRRKDGALEQLIQEGGIRHKMYDINGTEGIQNDEKVYTGFNETSDVQIKRGTGTNKQTAIVSMKVIGKIVEKEGEIEEHSTYETVISVGSTYDPALTFNAVKTALEKVYEKTRKEFGEVEVKCEKDKGGKIIVGTRENYFSVKPEEGSELQRKDLVRGNILSKILRVASIPAMAVCSLSGLISMSSNDIGTFYHGAECSDIEDITDERDECYSVGEASVLINSGNLEAGRGKLVDFVDEHPGRSYRPVTGVLEARAYVAEEAQLVLAGEIETPDYSDELTKVRRAKKKALPGSRVRSQINKYQESLEFAQEHPDRVYVIQNGDIDGAIDPDTIANDIAGKLLASQDSRYVKVDNQTELAQKINVANDNFKEIREGDYYTQGVGFIVELPASDNPIE
jgi:hypothetical protein